MLGLWVGLGDDHSLDEVVALMERWFPERSLGRLDHVLGEDEPWPEIVVDVSELDGEFAVMVEFWAFPGEVDAATELLAFVELARRFHLHWGCPTICDGSGLGDRGPECQFDSVVWKDGTPWLADDRGTDFADGEGGPVRLTRTLTFDSDASAAVLRDVAGARFGD